MKRVVISHYDIMNTTKMVNGIIKERLLEAGFDLTKIMHQRQLPYEDKIEFTQED